jgi:hypothetical protein
MPLDRVVALIGFGLGLGALILQFSLTIPLRMSRGHDLVDALVFFFTFFTILTNIMLVLVYLSEVAGWRWLGWWRSAVTRAMMAGAIALVMGFYHLVLAGIWSPEGLFLLADTLLHYVTPTLYIVWWLVFQPKGNLRFGHVGWMLLPPGIWLAWAMLRGALIEEYPYPILEAHVLGYPQVALNIAFMLALLTVIFVVVVALDQALGRVGRNPPVL